MIDKILVSEIFSFFHPSIQFKSSSFIFPFFLSLLFSFPHKLDEHEKISPIKDEEVF